MAKFLLTGAGFSRNWGGWLANEAFEYLLGCSEITENIRDRLWASKRNGLGFEHTLGRLRFDASVGPAFRHAEDVPVLQSMLEGMFNSMNDAFKNVEFNPAFDIHTIGYSPDHIRSFLAQFDAIFTLNQDCLLELKYAEDNLVRHSNGRWRQLYCPGVQELKASRIAAEAPKVFSPDPKPYELQRGSQPYFKLHGSSNWRDGDSKLLIMGGDKIPDIQKSPLLTSYRKQFEKMVWNADAKLLVIGYGFQDPHINSLVENACESGAKIFVIDPLGVDVLKDSPKGDNANSDFKHIWSKAVVGASRRSLIEIFSTDRVERAKIMRFLG